MNSFVGLILTLFYGCFCLAAGIASNLIAGPIAQGAPEQVALMPQADAAPSFILPSPQGLLSELSEIDVPAASTAAAPVQAVPPVILVLPSAHEPTLQEILAGRMWTELPELQDTAGPEPSSSFLGPFARIAVQ